MVVHAWHPDGIFSVGSVVCAAELDNVRLFCIVQSSIFRLCSFRDISPCDESCFGMGVYFEFNELIFFEGDEREER